MLSACGVNVQAMQVVTKESQVKEALEALPESAKQVVVKAQIHAGGRGRGSFPKTRLQGGVHLVPRSSEGQVLALVQAMLGNCLVTKQTDAGGELVQSVMLAEALDIAQESYFAVLLDASQKGAVLVGCPEGGVDIETAPRDRIRCMPVASPDTAGPTESQLLEMAQHLGFAPALLGPAAEQMRKIYGTFWGNRATQVEINPFGVAPGGKVVAFDAKIQIDDNFCLLHPDWSHLEAGQPRTELEAAACKLGMGLVELGGGSTACLVNGAGLAMATMDILSAHGGSPANFLDVGGGATAENLQQAVRLLLKPKNVRCVFVNVFGGIMRCDHVARAIVAASPSFPIVARLRGAFSEEGQRILQQSGLPYCYIISDLDEAAKLAVSLSADQERCIA